MNKWYLSSTGANELSATIKGFFSLGLVSALAVGLNLFGADLDVTDLNALLDSVTGTIVAIGGLGSSLYALAGLGRRLYNKAFSLGAYK